MNIIFFDEKEWLNLHPLTLTKPVSELRIGILTFRERWSKLLDGQFSFLAAEYLTQKFPLIYEEHNLFLNPAFFPNENLIQNLRKIKPGTSIWNDGQLVSAYVSREDFKEYNFPENSKIEMTGILRVSQLWDLFIFNDYAIKFDFELLTKGRKSQPVSDTNGLIHPENIFVEEGATVEHSVLNAKSGPIYIGKNAEVMEGVLVRGSLALCHNAKINMGAKIYSGTTVGPYCKVGGEINNSVIMGYSNKGHDGFLGHSVLGEWCNLGADTNNSNLKNNYSQIKIWHYGMQDYVDTGLQFCGLMMGDFSKSAINTQFNTGTVVGICANVFEAGFPPKFIPSYSWGGGKNSVKFELEKAYEAVEKMMERRKKYLQKEDKIILNHIFQLKEY